MPPDTTSTRSPTPRGTVVAAIPARYASTRLPGKPLLPIAGRPMIEHVYGRAQRAPGIDRVVVLTDDERIADAVRSFGGMVEMTPGDCASGTDRIAHAAQHWEAMAVVNVQGDEPLIDPAAVGLVASHLVERPGDPVVTLASPAEPEEWDDPNAVKVVVDRDGYALYFSRSRIPFSRHPETDPGPAPLKHVGLYGYQRAALLELAALKPTPLERAEGLEQLRALEHRIRIRVLLSTRLPPGVDTRGDLERAEELLLSTTKRGLTEPGNDRNQTGR